MVTFLIIFLTLVFSGSIIGPVCYSGGKADGADEVWKKAEDEGKAQFNPKTGEREFL